MNKATNNMLKQGLLAMLVMLLSAGSALAQQSLFFSEYIEGGGNNKAFEIFNPTDDDIDLGNYIILGNYNGNPFNDTLRFTPGTILASMDVYVVAHADADPAITDVADSLIENPFNDGTSYIAVFNGDDARALVYIDGTDSTIVDYFGTADNDPGSGWDVAGVSAATKDHTLVRKANIKQGNPVALSSFGTESADSEWEVYDKDNLDFIGDHIFREKEPVMVHFNVNTSTMPDTLRGHHFMQIRGGFVGPDVTGAASNGMITWDSMSRHMYSMGGDYWWSDFLMSPGDTLNYKFWAGVNPDTPLTNGSEQGW